ncbi:Uncharacterised protein [BD1-7 clade bacterium]|uniref:DUF1853 family protein n=1 Tax=BD1-7 clade bacterium TaxID=2029982 RepID=A0A5S9PTR6_9GAMM|nr:Uncharacterised protein [BD1-7 clade bacterium]
MPLRHPNVRDLFWAVASPEMMVQHAHNSLTVLPDADWFLALDRSPQALEAHLQQRNLWMLGTYFEALWEFYLTNNPNTQLLAKNVQVFVERNGRPATLGEIDFVYFCHQRRKAIHLEVAVKYYMFVGQDEQGSTSDLDHWIGPQCNDRLDIKYKKLIGRQSTIAQTQEGKRALAELGIGECESEIALKGFLFYPIGNLAAPALTNDGHQRGIWLRQSEVREWLVHYQAECRVWQVLEKPSWLATELDRFPVMTNDELLHRVECHFTHSGGLSGGEEDASVRSPRPLQCAGFVLGTEVVRFFVVPDSWPLLTKATTHLMLGSKD